MKTERDALLTVRISPSRLEEFRIAAMLRGTTMSSLVLQFITQVVREEMVAVPEAFRRRQNAQDSSLRAVFDPGNDNN